MNHKALVRERWAPIRGTFTSLISVPLIDIDTRQPAGYGDLFFEAMPGGGFWISSPQGEPLGIAKDAVEATISIFGERIDWEDM